MKKYSKSIQIIFLTLICAIVLIPSITINTQKEYRSEIDNSMLPEFPAFDSDFFDRLNTYVESRVGFRTEIITAYQRMNIALFHYLAHPLYEYGEDDWIMTKRWDQVQTLHLDVPDEYIETFADFEKELYDITCKHGAKFMFVLVPNKETIYFEKISRGYNIYPNDETKSDKIIKEIKNKNIPYLYFKDSFMKQKNEILLYNKKYDAGHWNDNGAMLGAINIYDYLINDMNINVSPVKREDFEITQHLVPYLLDSRIPINDLIPLYTPKSIDYVTDGEDFWEGYEFIKDTSYHSHTVSTSPDTEKAPKLLIVGDSYMIERQKFFANSFSEVTIIHKTEAPKLGYYLDKFHPDIVIHEATERVIGPDQDYDIEYLESIYEYKE